MECAFWCIAGVFVGGVSSGAGLCLLLQEAERKRRQRLAQKLAAAMDEIAGCKTVFELQEVLDKQKEKGGANA